MPVNTIPLEIKDRVIEVLDDCHGDGFDRILCAYHLGLGEYAITAIAKNKSVYCLRVWGASLSYSIDAIG